MSTDIDTLRVLEVQRAQEAEAALLRAREPKAAERDYLTIEEAAEYCRLGVSEFYERAKLYNIPHGTALGTKKRIYRRYDLQRFIEWHGFGQGAHIGRSSGPGPTSTPRPGRRRGTRKASDAATPSTATSRSSPSKPSSASSSTPGTGSDPGPRPPLSIVGGKTT